MSKKTIDFNTGRGGTGPDGDLADCIDIIGGSRIRQATNLHKSKNTMHMTQRGSDYEGSSMQSINSQEFLSPTNPRRASIKVRADEEDEGDIDLSGEMKYGRRVMPLRQGGPVLMSDEVR